MGKLEGAFQIHSEEGIRREEGWSSCSLLLVNLSASSSYPCCDGAGVPFLMGCLPGGCHVLGKGWKSIGSFAVVSECCFLDGVRDKQLCIGFLELVFFLY